ncbi:MAG TPA: hypothetical protein PLH19_04355 [Anaerolineae bacterium]|nr:hypothetical protein [Anaerolineae bacterium]HQH37753.1 hypothetical protein [Anaerolineae bacterium]
MSMVSPLSGRGAQQYAGIGAALYRASTEARMLCDQADALPGYALTCLCFAGLEAELNLTLCKRHSRICCPPQISLALDA